ncbi:MAG TPA: hypothetical protein ENH62_13995 [Marinobacter sp.]|uniref:Uncharacterized protein n=1 Tax=marine sediment metagenome TaxID=412755 RepID=A0A0F9VFQ8_9ZZZZ|nr:hypothetical protein [Marinobacter sp.]
MPDHYYEEDKSSKNAVPYKENKYSKYMVESALDKVTEAQEYMDDPKMVKYMKAYLVHKKTKLTEAEGKFAAVEKVGNKMKKMGM